MFKIGSHVSMKAPNYLVGAINEAQSYGATALMIYSGPPQSTKRVDMELYKVDEAKLMIDGTDIKWDNMILHAPYIINLANTIKPETAELAVNFLVDEIIRAQHLGIKVIVLHPGAHVGAGVAVGVAKIVEGLNKVFSMVDMKDTVIALETMAGKGTEIGRTFQELKMILDGVDQKESIGFCLDTCHIHDAGYDLNDFDQILKDFDDVLGLDRLKVVHLNDSKNERAAKKDRHANLGEGYIGFDKLCEIAHHPKLAHLAKILETPFIEGNAPYKEEISMLKEKVYKPIER